MDTIIINLRNGSVKTCTDVYNTILSGSHLIITTKKTDQVDGEVFVYTTNEVLDLKEILNYTIKIKSKKYDQD